MDFKKALKRSQAILMNTQSGAASSELAELAEKEAEILMMEAYRKTIGQPLSRIEFFSKMNETFPDEACSLLLEWSELRAQGHPLQHLTQRQTFLDHEYEVGPEVLIPRPETELLLMMSVEALSKNQKPPTLGLEIGIGSGVLSIELLARFPTLRIFASEFKDDARLCALKNADRILGPHLHPDRLQILRALNRNEVLEPFERAFSSSSPLSERTLCEGTVFESTLLEEKADFLISNPPYLSPEDPIEPQVVDFEPKEALFPPGEDPLFFYRKMAENASWYLKPDGFLFAEIPHHRSREIKALFSDSEWEVQLIQDLNQRDRIISLKRRSATHG